MPHSMTVTQVQAADTNSLASNKVSEEEKKLETVEEQKNVDEINQEITKTLRKLTEEEKKAEILKNG